MAIINKPLGSWDSDLGTLTYDYDDTVTTGFPFGKFVGFRWDNGAPYSVAVQLTLEPGVTSADMLAVLVTAIPMGGGLKTPIYAGLTAVVGGIDFGGISFTVAANAAVGATAIAVTGQTLLDVLPSGSQVQQPMPPFVIPASGGTATESAFYSNLVVGSTDSVNLTSLNVPMISYVSHGITFVALPADVGVG
jgi:hypothetical protein